MQWKNKMEIGQWHGRSSEHLFVIYLPTENNNNPSVQSRVDFIVCNMHLVWYLVSYQIVEYMLFYFPFLSIIWVSQICSLVPYHTEYGKTMSLN